MCARLGRRIGGGVGLVEAVDQRFVEAVEDAVDTARARRDVVEVGLAPRRGEDLLLELAQLNLDLFARTVPAQPRLREQHFCAARRRLLALEDLRHRVELAEQLQRDVEFPLAQRAFGRIEPRLHLRAGRRGEHAGRADLRLQRGQARHGGRERRVGALRRRSRHVFVVAQQCGVDVVEAVHGGERLAVLGLTVGTHQPHTQLLADLADERLLQPGTQPGAGRKRRAGEDEHLRLPVERAGAGVAFHAVVGDELGEQVALRRRYRRAHRQQAPLRRHREHEGDRHRIRRRERLERREGAVADALGELVEQRVGRGGHFRRRLRRGLRGGDSLVEVGEHGLRRRVGFRDIGRVHPGSLGERRRSVGRLLVLLQLGLELACLRLERARVVEQRTQFLRLVGRLGAALGIGVGGRLRGIDRAGVEREMRLDQRLQRIADLRDRLRLLQRLRLLVPGRNGKPLRQIESRHGCLRAKTVRLRVGPEPRTRRNPAPPAACEIQAACRSYGIGAAL